MSARNHLSVEIDNRKYAAKSAMGRLYVKHALTFPGILHCSGIFVHSIGASS